MISVWSWMACSFPRPYPKGFSPTLAKKGWRCRPPPDVSRSSWRRSCSSPAIAKFTGSSGGIKESFDNVRDFAKQRMTVMVKAGLQPGQTARVFSVLAAAGTTDGRTASVVTASLPCSQHCSYGFRHRVTLPHRCAGHFFPKCRYRRSSSA